MKKKPAKTSLAKKAKPVASPEQVADALFARVATILEEARASTVRAVNSRMVLAHWLIGREIVQELQEGEKRAAYGNSVIDQLAAKLCDRFGTGYSSTNLKAFRFFFVIYADREPSIRHTLCAESSGKGDLPQNAAAQKRIRHSLSAELETSFEKSHATRNQFPSTAPIQHTACAEFAPPFHPSLSWTHYRTIMRVEKPEAREFYEQEAVASGWNVRELERQIHSLYYERLLASRDKKGMLREQRKAIPYDPASILKSSAVLEFLGLPDSPRLHESDLEQAIMDNLQTFLLEMGRGFSFVARQKRVVFEDDEFFVDLVFYNYLLKCFVLIDLKIGKLTHQDIGQMDGYVRLYEDLFKVEGDNPTIGLILCSEKNQTIARYSVLKESRQLFAKKYRLQLPSEDELAAELKREILAIREKGGCE
jgi:predicted nuclease of restriction endonuclease-like (RecB) superfamily